MTDTPPPPGTVQRVRLDKWLWAARFFRTRSLAQAAVDGGKVHVDGLRVKPAHAVRVGSRLEVHSGHADMEILVVALAETRGSAAHAQTLYTETEASRNRRAAERAARALAGPQVSAGRPDKHQRAMIRGLRQKG